MSSLLEKSLDEIIGSKSSARAAGNKRRNQNSRNHKNGKRGGISKPRGEGSRRPHFQDRPRGGVIHGKPTEVKITNLHPDLTVQDLTKLMETIGPVVKVDIKYNTQGKSTGVALVEYEYGRDAMEAIRQYNGRLAAGLILNVSTNMPLIDRIGGKVGRHPQHEISRKKARGKLPKGEKPKKKERKSVDDLDKELSMYMNGESEVAVEAESSQINPIIPATEPSEQVAEISPANAAAETLPANAAATDVAMEQ